MSTSSPATLSSSKVTIDLTKIASQHPAWKLAQELESSPSNNLALNWVQPDKQITINATLPTSTFANSNSKLSTIDFAEPEKSISASNMQTLDAQMTQEQQAAWEKWGKNINESLQADRQQISQAMRVNLNDQIAGTQKNIPKIGAPLTPPINIQNEMINLRLKLLNNIALSPDDKAATQKRLEQLETQWTDQLRQQAQQGADKQKYWRETVPRQMRQTGEANIQQTLQALKHQDQKAIDLTVNNQQQWLKQDSGQNFTYSLTSPQIIAEATHTESTFHAPVLAVKSINANFAPIPAPMITTIEAPTASQIEERQLKHVAIEAAKRAVGQSAVLHHWQVVSLNTKMHTALPDVTSVVLHEANF